MSRDCCVALPRGAMGLSAVCDSGISSSYSLTIFVAKWFWWFIKEMNFNFRMFIIGPAPSKLRPYGITFVLTPWHRLCGKMIRVVYKRNEFQFSNFHNRSSSKKVTSVGYNGCIEFMVQILWQILKKEACIGVLEIQDICHLTSRDIGNYPLRDTVCNISVTFRDIEYLGKLLMGIFASL